MVRTVFGLAASLALACGSPAADDPAGAGQAEWRKLDGRWRVVSHEVDGVEQPPGQLPDRLVLTFKDGNFERGGGPRGKVARIDTTTSPRQIDYQLGGTDKVELGIYALEGDVLVHCTAPPGADRPAAFASAKGSGHTLVVYKRVKRKVD